MVDNKPKFGFNCGTEMETQDILDAFPFYVLLVDEDHYILEANSAVKEHLGVKREDIIGKYCPLIIHGTNEPFEGCPLEDAVNSNKAVEKELPDKKTGRWVMSSIYPTRAVTPSGKTIFLHMVMDITDRKRAQEQLRISHKQLRELSAHLESVREEEKKKISRDLHDETSQVLSSLHAYLEAAIRTLPEDSNQTRDILKKAQTLSTTIHDEIRKLIYELRPSMLDQLGLEAATNALIDGNLRAAGLKVKFKTTGESRRLPPSLEISLYRVVQETFANILKHARAKNVEVSLAFLKQTIKISIKDDGIGFRPGETLNTRDKPRGMGLLGMRERIELVNGSLDLESGPGKGTRVVIEVPLKDDDKNGQD